jgi:hypothetical protein
MNREEFLDAQYKISVTAGMNQRYHQAFARYWVRWDRASRISVGVLAVGGVMLAVVTAVNTSAWWVGLSILIAGLAALVAITLNVVPLPDWALQSSDLFRRWSDLREEVDSLEYGVADKPSGALVDRLKQVSAKVHRICAIEPAADEKFLCECLKAEEASRRAACEQPVPAAA